MSGGVKYATKQAVHDASRQSISTRWDVRSATTGSWSGFDSLARKSTDVHVAHTDLKQVAKCGKDSGTHQPYCNKTDGKLCTRKLYKNTDTKGSIVHRSV